MTDIYNPRFGESSPDPSWEGDPRVYGGLGDAALFGDAYPIDPGFVEYERERGTSFVTPDSHGKIYAGKDEEARLVVAGLEGNSVLAVVMDNMTGTRAAYVNQFTPLTGRIVVEQLPDDLKDLLHGWVAVRATLLAEGRMVIDEQSSDLRIAPRDQSLGIALGQVIKREFGEAAEFEVAPYEVSPHYPLATLVDLPPEGSSHVLTARVPRAVAQP